MILYFSITVLHSRNRGMSTVDEEPAFTWSFMFQWDCLIVTGSIVPFLNELKLSPHPFHMTCPMHPFHLAVSDNKLVLRDKNSTETY